MKNITNNSIKNLIEKYPEYWNKKSYKKGTTLYSEGNIANKICYLEKGIAKVFLVGKKNKYPTIAFHSDGDIFVPYISFTENIPTRVNIELITNAEVYEISKDNWHELAKLEPELNKYISQIMQVQHIKMFEYIYDLNCCSTSERYELAMKQMPF